MAQTGARDLDPAFLSSWWLPRERSSAPRPVGVRFWRGPVTDWCCARGWGAAQSCHLLLAGCMPAPHLRLLAAGRRVRNGGLECADRLGAIANGGLVALERGPFLVALAATLNAGARSCLPAALYSAWKLKAAGGSGQRAAGCLLIAIGTVVVARADY